MEMRRATLQDLDYILECLHSLWKYEASINHQFKAEGYITNSMKSEIAWEIVDDSYVILIWEKNSENIWICYWYKGKKSSFWNYDILSEIDYLFVEEKYRNKWYAKKMMQEMCKILKKHGADTVRLKMISWNTIAEDFYKGMGFREVFSTFDKKL